MCSNLKNIDTYVWVDICFLCRAFVNFIYSFVSDITQFAHYTAFAKTSKGGCFLSQEGSVNNITVYIRSQY